MQTQTSNTLHNAIMEASSNDRPLMLAPDNDIYSTVDACPNACEMWKAIERNQCKVTNHQVNVQFLLQLQLEWQRSQQAATRNRGKAIVNSSQPIYDQEPSMVAEDDEMSQDKEIDKLIAFISLSFKKINKPTNNNLRTSSNTGRANQNNSPRINRSAGYENQRNGNVAGARETVGSTMKPKREKDAAYHKEKMLCKQEEAGIQLNAEQADWRDDTVDDELEDLELEAHYMYMAQLQEVSPDTADSGPIFVDEPLQKHLGFWCFGLCLGGASHTMVYNMVTRLIGGASHTMVYNMVTRLI
nr:hypothetical protein [Tanacetum cinerariifolium]